MKIGPNIVTDGLVFGYDTGYGVADNVISTRFYKGKPTANTWNKNTHSYTSGDITATRNATPPVPPPIEVQGFEVYKLQSNDGALNQGIMGTSQVVNGVGGDYVHSVYCYLESGTTVTVGQHWHPWAYGSSQTPPIGEWVRLSQTVTNAVTNYGNIANAYRTNGIAYFTAPQYELGSDVSPHVDGTRSSTTSLIDLKKTTDIDVANNSFDSTGQPTLDGTDDYIYPNNITNGSGLTSITAEFVVKASANNKNIIKSNSNAILLHYGGAGFYLNSTDSTTSGYLGWNGKLTGGTGVYEHLVATWDGTTMKLYVNGEPTGTTRAYSAGSTGVLKDLNSVVIGGYFNSTQPHFNGDIPIAKIYSNALSDSEIKQNFNVYRKRFGI